MTRRPRRLALTIAAAIVAALMTLALAACGSDSYDDTGTPTTGTTSTTGSGKQIVTGSAECSQTALAKAVDGWGKSNKTNAELPTADGSYQCADGWAVAFPNAGPAAEAVTITLVFEAEGQFWVPQDRIRVCGKDSPVPKQLYKSACRTN